MSGVKSTVVGWARSLLVNAFLASFEPQEIAGKLRAIVGMKALDPPIISAERNRMWDVVDRAEPCLPASRGLELAQMAGVVHQGMGGIWVDPQTSIDDQGAQGGDNQRVAIELGYFRHFLDQPADPV